MMKIRWVAGAAPYKEDDPVVKEAKFLVVDVRAQGDDTLIFLDRNGRPLLVLPAGRLIEAEEVHE